MRLPTVSDTSSRPVGSIARPRGAVSCPGARARRRRSCAGSRRPGRTPRCGRWRCRPRRCRPAGSLASARGNCELAGFGAGAAPRAGERQLRGELDDAVVAVVGHVHVAGGVQRDAVGEAELPRPVALRAGFGFEGAFGVEFLDAVVVVVGDDHLAFVGGHPARVGELAGAAAVGAPLHRFAAFEVEALDAVVAGVGDVHVVARDRDAAAGRLAGVLRRSRSRTRPSSLPRWPQAVMNSPFGAELLDPVVAGVDHVHVAGRVGRQPADRPELAVAAAVGAPLASRTRRRR